MEHAVVVAAGKGLDEEDLSSFGKVVYGSLPQLKRLVITAQRAGIRKFTIITEGDDFPLRKVLSNDKRIESDIYWHPLGSPIDFDGNPALILQSNLITTPDVLSDFINNDLTVDDEIFVLVDSSDDAWVKINGDEVEDIFLYGGKALGAFIAAGDLIGKSISDSICLRTWTKELIGSGKVKFKSCSNGYWMRLTSDKGSAEKANDLLFSNVGKTATGWISRKINSKFSLPTSRILVRTPLTPNMISVIINIIGMLNGVFYALGHPVLGALFMEIATILDRCDGEVARVKLMDTKKGQWVDTIADQFTVLSFIIGVPIGYYYWVAQNKLILVLGGINLAIFIFFVVWSFYFLVKYTSSGSLVAYFRVDNYVGEENMSFLHKFIVFIRPLARRNVYALGFLVLAIVGGYPWVLGVLTIAMVLFLIHQIEDIIKLRKQRLSD